jgi:ATP-dependent Clp protease ATP-binding subunit ClpB
MSDLRDFPAWAAEVYARLPVTPQLVLAGNVADLHLAPTAPGGTLQLMPTVPVVRECLRASGYAVVLSWDVVAGLSVLHEASPGAAAGVVGQDLWGRRQVATAEDLAAALHAVVHHAALRIGLVVAGVPRLAPDPEEPALHRVYVTAEHLSRTAPRHRLDADIRSGLHNVVVWVVDRESDLPHWLVGGGGVRVVNIPMPTLDTRRQAAELSVPALPGYRRLDPDARARVANRLADHTEGMTLSDVSAVVPVAIDRTIPAERVEDSVRFLRSGLDTSPWREKEVRERIRHAAESLNDAVLGQHRAVRKAVDVLARAALGLSGTHTRGHATRPQGVLFLAGPTGVGKTELAKQIATTVFGREEAMVRFDMSEFSSEHTEARLLGAPPGYVGHDAGGELTNAVRRRPFCLLLFDEIDKAAPRILDKFLQILEDGRLTDGSGSTVHFTETLIVFTSNLGIYEKDEHGNPKPVVLPGTRYEEVERKVREAIHQEFLRLNRPELLNRIGDNIVVFDFITKEVARTLLRRNLDHATREVAARTGNKVSFEPVLPVLDTELVKPESLAFGGRAVGSTVESRVLNPLARALLTHDGGQERYVVTRLWRDEEGAQLELSGDIATAIPSAVEEESRGGHG